MPNSEVISSSRLHLLTAFENLEYRLINAQSGFAWSTDRKFLDYAWKDFDVKHVAGILLDPRPSFFAHKEVLFAGLCAYVASFGNAKIIRHAMILTTADLMIRAEKRATSEVGGKAQLGEIKFRMSPAGYAFYQEIYNPVGGLKRITGSRSSRSTPGL